MKRSFKLLMASAAVAAVCAPAPRADGFVSPWAAVQFGEEVSTIFGRTSTAAGALSA